MLKFVSLMRRPVMTRPSLVATATASYSGAMSLEGSRIDSMMYSGARRLAIRSRLGPIRPPSPPMLWHLAHWALPLRSKKSFRPACGSPGMYGFQVLSDGDRARLRM